MGSLQGAAGSIKALKTLFEAKGATPKKPASSFPAANITPHSKVDDVLAMNGEVEEAKTQVEEKRDPILVNEKPDAKAKKASQQVNRFMVI